MGFFPFLSVTRSLPGTHRSRCRRWGRSGCCWRSPVRRRAKTPRGAQSTAGPQQARGTHLASKYKHVSSEQPKALVSLSNTLVYQCWVEHLLTTKLTVLFSFLKRKRSPSFVDLSLHTSIRLDSENFKKCQQRKS